MREGGREDEFNLDGGINRNVFLNLVREKWMWEGVICGEDVRGGERGGKRGCINLIIVLNLVRGKWMWEGVIGGEGEQQQR